MASRPTSGPNWRVFRKLSLFGGIAALCVSLSPWWLCTSEQMKATAITPPAGVDGHGFGSLSGDESRTYAARGFLSRFWGAAPACYSDHPVGTAEWQWPALVGLFGGFFVFGFMDRRQYLGRVRRTSQAYTAYDYTASVPRLDASGAQTRTNYTGAPRSLNTSQGGHSGGYRGTTASYVAPGEPDPPER